MPDPWAATWNQTLAALLAEPNARVWRHCSGCNLHIEITMDQIAALIRDPQFGPLYSLWNRRPSPCLTTGCASDNFFMSSNGGFVSPMISTDRMIPKLHRRWRRAEACLRECCGED
jgi:hypothetical protein